MHLKPQPKIPGLQSCGVCVSCGQRAESFCSGCRVTPYCGPACQRRDWVERHKNTCHNLKRQSLGVAIEPDIPAVAPLRRPRSPDSGSRDSGNDRLPPRKFGPPGIASAPTPTAKSYNNSRGSNAGGNNRAQGDSDRGHSDRGQMDRGQSDRGRMDRGQSDRGRMDRGQVDKGQSDRGQSDRGRMDRGHSDRGQSDNRGRFNRSADDDSRPNARPNDRNRDNSSYNRKNDDRQDRPRNQDGGNKRHGQAGSGRPQEDEDWGPKPSEPKPALVPSPKEVPASPAAAAPGPARPLASVADVAPVLPRKQQADQTKPPAQKPTPALVPKNCVIDTLSVNDTFMLTAESAAENGSGFICVTLHLDHSDNYERLLDPLSQACEASEACEARPGDTFAYLDSSDGGWYRARCLAPTRAALLDAARLVALAPTDQCRRLHTDFAVIPEFCCHLESGNVQVKDQVQCTLVSKSGSDLTVSLTNLESGATLGTGSVRRWLPTVEWPEGSPAGSSGSEPPQTEPATDSSSKSATSVPGSPPQVPRPAVTAGSAVVLVDATEPARVFVRPAARAQQAEFNDIVCEVVLYGADESTPRLKELPTAGQTVVARFADGNHYRALVQRVSTKHKRCLLEYIEYGNAAIVEDLESLCPCPPQFDPLARPTLTSAVSLLMKQKAFSAAATAYLDKLKDDEEELTLTIPSGEKSGPSKTPVRLTVVKSGEEVNRTVDQLSTPEWQKILERGGDVLEVETMFFQHITYVDPPAAGGDMEILDCSLLKHGMLSGHVRNAEHAKRALALAAQLDEYCNSALARDQYTPKLEELCIAMCPTRKQWLRAALLEQIGGPGSAEANILFYDYGYMAAVPITALRRMMPEFARGIPAAACTLLIKDFPPEPTEEQQQRARRHLQLGEHGVGSLQVTKVTKQDVGEYLVEAPDLIRAIA